MRVVCCFVLNIRKCLCDKVIGLLLCDDDDDDCVKLSSFYLLIHSEIIACVTFMILEEKNEDETWEKGYQQCIPFPKHKSDLCLSRL